MGAPNAPVDPRLTLCLSLHWTKERVVVGPKKPRLLDRFDSIIFKIIFFEKLNLHMNRALDGQQYTFCFE